MGRVATVLVRRISPRLPTTDAEFQAVMREFGAFVAEIPTTDAEWQQAMRTAGLLNKVTPKRPTTDAEWQSGFLRMIESV